MAEDGREYHAAELSKLLHYNRYSLSLNSIDADYLLWHIVYLRVRLKNQFHVNFLLCLKQRLMNRFCLALLAAFMCFLYMPAYSQHISITDTLVNSLPASLFLEANAGQARLNNGREYIPASSNIKGHPFFETNIWAPGNVVYDGAAFNKVNMLYDLSKDELVILNYALPNGLSLVRQKVKQFEFLSHRFIYLAADSFQSPMKEGFYDVLYSGKLTVLAKRKKTVRLSSSTNTDANFIADNLYYLVKEGVIFPVHSQSSVMKLLKDKKAGIQQSLRKSNIVYRKDPEGAMVAMAAYYDQN